MSLRLPQSALVDDRVKFYRAQLIRVASAQGNTRLAHWLTHGGGRLVSAVGYAALEVAVNAQVQAFAAWMIAEAGKRSKADAAGLAHSFAMTIEMQSRRVFPHGLSVTGLAEAAYEAFENAGFNGYAKTHPEEFQVATAPGTAAEMAARAASLEPHPPRGKPARKPPARKPKPSPSTSGKLKGKKLDAEISKLVSFYGANTQINIMDLSKIDEAIKGEYGVGIPLEEAVENAILRYRIDHPKAAVGPVPERRR